VLEFPEVELATGAGDGDGEGDLLGLGLGDGLGLGEGLFVPDVEPLLEFELVPLLFVDEVAGDCAVCELVPLFDALFVLSLLKKTAQTRPAKPTITSSTTASRTNDILRGLS
jgi:hypothetical protein